MLGFFCLGAAISKTVTTSSTSYASATNLINAHDVRKIGEYATDTDVRLTPGAVLTDAKVSAALLRASGIVESYCLRGGRYTPSDLAALTGAGQAMLVGLVADIAFYLLAKRRVPDPTKVAGWKEAEEMLKALALGEAIFSFQETADAGKTTVTDISEDRDGYFNRPTELARRFFGSRMSASGKPFTGRE